MKKLVLFTFIVALLIGCAPKQPETLKEESPTTTEIPPQEETPPQEQPVEESDIDKETEEYIEDVLIEEEEEVDIGDII